MLSFVRHLSDDTKVSSLFIKHVLPFFISVTLGAVVSILLQLNLGEEPIVWIMRTIALILICFVISALCVFVAVLRLIAVEEQRNMHRVTISKDHPELGDRCTAFDYCSAVAKQAMKSIYVVGPHFSNHLDHPPGTKTHSDYLNEHMSAAINRHTGGLGADDAFEYFRIIQLDASVASDIVDENGFIAWNSIGNDALSNHVNSMLNTNKGSEFVNINVYARDFIPSLPSILVIDEQFVFFSLPTYLTRNVDIEENKKRKNLMTINPTLNYDFVFEIEDKSGIIPQQFKRLIRQLSVDANRIQGVHDKTPEAKSSTNG